MSWLRRILQFAAPGAHAERSHYDAASTSRLMDWRNASDVGPNEALQAELSVLRKRARFEMRNNGVAKGLGRKYANFAVGPTGPRAKVKSQNAEWNRAVELAWRNWAATCGYRRHESFAQILHLGVRQFFPCGEFFVVPRASRGVDPVRLRLLPIRPDRVENPTGQSLADGVETDGDGVPVAYHVRTDDPDNQAVAVSSDYQRIPAEQVLHVFMTDDPIQLRGEPWLSQMLAVFHKLRRVDEGTITAVEMATKFAAFLTAQFPDLGDNFDALVPSTMDLENGTLTTLPPGYRPEQVKPEHPTANLAEFRRDKYSDAGAGICMPVNAVTGDSSKHNFASARFDGLMFLTDVAFVRGEIESQCCHRVFQWWFREAVLAGVITAPAFPYAVEWLWPVNQAHVSPDKEANASRTHVEIGDKTVGDLVLADGRDDDDHFDRLVAEVEQWRAAGLKHPIDAQAATQALGQGMGQAPEQEEEPDDEEEDTTEEGDAEVA